jgi:hypothetical protein
MKKKPKQNDEEPEIVWPSTKKEGADIRSNKKLPNKKQIFVGEENQAEDIPYT